MGKTALEAVETMKILYDNECVSERIIFKWNAIFEQSRDTAKLIPHGGKPKTAIIEVNVNTVRALVQKIRAVTDEKIAKIMDILIRSAHAI